MTSTPGSTAKIDGDAHDYGRSALDLLIRFQSYFVLLLILILAAILSPERNGENVFLDSRNLLNIIRFASENGIIAIGMTLVIITGGIDLSVGAVLALCAVASAVTMMQYDFGVPLTLLTVLAIGTAAGLINGVVSTKLRLQSFITTLATMSIARGVASLWADGYAVPLAYGDGENLAPPLYRTLFAGSVQLGELSIPVQVFYFLGIALIASFVLRRTRFGRHIYAVGGNDTAARFSGINVDRVRIAVFAITGFLVGVAALLHSALVSQGSHIDGQGYELNAIAAVVIGGTNLMGGVGTIGGTVIGALILQVLDNILGLRNVQSEYQAILKGVIIVVAVVLQRQRR
ncbi:MAG TPA: ABC transporter permease [Thermomicrobiales bacterium]|nr:ABC transporter permease [Thermomicrobiales bacterium]